MTQNQKPIGKKEKKTKCIMCGNKLKPDKNCQNFESGEWDGHTFYPCDKCMPFYKGNLRISIG
jgi:hypothetical protein